jgi:fumarylacetoacetase
MTAVVNDTHDARLRSWVESACTPGCGFPIQNLPLGVFRTDQTGDRARIGVAIGRQILDLAACVRRQLFEGLPEGVKEACQYRSLNALMGLGSPAWSALRRRVSELLRDGDSGQAWLRPAAEACLVPMRSAEMLLGADIGDYSDFYASIHHALNVGRMMRPENPLLPNYKHVPIGYHGRSSSIVASGASVRRPSGQTLPEGAVVPVFGPTRRLDYELEVGFYVGPGCRLGRGVPIAEAEQHLFGACLVNDWSARDIQAWEYQPLGPFLSKSFMTSVSPWIVTMEALAPYRIPPPPRDAGDPPPLAYLDSEENRRSGGIDVTLEVALQSAGMREQRIAPIRVCRSNLRHLYWTPAQLLAHHASNGCNLKPATCSQAGQSPGRPRTSVAACSN